MKISKLEGIKLLDKLNMPCVELLDISKILDGTIPIDYGISVRLSPKDKWVKWNVGLPSINRRTDVEEVREFVDKYKGKYNVFAHKSVRPEIIGTLSKMKDQLAIETYKTYEDKGDEIVDNRIIVPVIGDRFYINKMTLMKEDENDFNNFRKVIMYLKDVPFSEYEMEYVIEDGDVAFMDFTVADSREYNSFQNIYNERY